MNELQIKKLSFTKRPIPLPAEYRPMYKIASIVMILKLCCRGESSTLLKLHLFSWALKFTKLAIKIGLTSNNAILHKILEGKIQSSTGLPYRGKGLPKIYSDYKANSLKKLIIAANDTFADFDNGTFIELNDPLNGTFLYWEISPN